MIGDLYIFLHLHKTGGTTFNAHMYHQLEWDTEFIQNGPWGNDFRKLHGGKEVPQRCQCERDKIRVIAGHNTKHIIKQYFPNRVVKYITFLREPADRIESYFNFIKCGGESREFEDWYKEYPSNSMTRFYKDRLGARTFREIKLMLDMFWFVGITKKLNDDFPLLFWSMGVDTKWKDYRKTDDKRSSIAELNHPDKRVLKRKFKLSKEQRKLIKERDRLDYELYEFAKKKRNKLFG